jgi:hypothetical protein
MSGENLNDEIERLRKENEALKKGASDVRMKVSEKGAVSVYGMGRFPVTLYKEQWLNTKNSGSGCWTCRPKFARSLQPMKRN